MAWCQPSTSKQSDMEQEIAESMKCWFEHIEEEKKVVKEQEQRAKRLKRVVLKRNYYRVYRKTCEMQDCSKVYKFHEIQNALQVKEDHYFLKVLGVYRYDSSGSHWLYHHAIKGIPLENPLKIRLNVHRITSCPRVDSFVEIFGFIEIISNEVFIIVHFFNEIPDDCFDEYLQQIKDVYKVCFS